MSPIRRILVHVGDADGVVGQLRVAARIAEGHGAEVAAVHAVEPISAAYLTPEVSALAIEAASRGEQARRDAAQARVREACPGATLLAGDGTMPTDASDLVVAASRGADLLVLSQSDASRPDGTRAGFAGRVLVGTACPVLFVPHVDWVAGLASPRPGFGTRVLVAWSDTRESARALRDALPLLQRAEHVELLTMVDADAFDAARGGAADGIATPAAYLALHGVRSTGTVLPSREPSLGERLRRAWIPDASVAETLLSRAADIDADLVVMGGYGHPRAWELVLGGVTRTMLQTMTVPVLMSH
jgi:nucleotide-binding universal stress UspA family protein